MRPEKHYYRFYLFVILLFVFNDNLFVTQEINPRFVFNHHLLVTQEVNLRFLINNNNNNNNPNNENIAVFL